MKSLGSLRLCLYASLLAFLLLPAQSQVAPRPAPDQITRPVDPTQLQILPNHHPLWANPANDLGPASSGLTLTMVLQRSPQQEAALQQLLIDQKNPASPNFHRWLSPVEFGQRFGISDDDLQAVRNWIESQGLTVQWVAGGGDFIANIRASAPLAFESCQPTTKSAAGMMPRRASHPVRYGYSERNFSSSIAPPSRSRT